MNTDNDTSKRDPSASEEDSPRGRGNERGITDILKRIVDAGVGKLSERPENLRQFVHDIKLPKELGGYVLSQIDETKTGLYRVVARELRDFLDHTNFAEELTKALTRLAFEIKMEIRFKPNETHAAGLPKASVESAVKLKTDHHTQPPQPTESTIRSPEKHEL